MKVLLRNTQTGWYYQAPSKWAPESKDACDLGQMSRTVELVFEEQLENVEVVLAYEDSRYDLVMPVIRAKA